MKKPSITSGGKMKALFALIILLLLAAAFLLNAVALVLSNRFPLSVDLTAAQVLAGQDSGSGVDLSRIAPLVDRLYVTGEADRAQLEAAASPLLEEPVSEGFLVLEDSMPEQAE